MKWLLLVSVVIGIGVYFIYSVARIDEFSDYVTEKSASVDICKSQAVQKAINNYIVSVPSAGIKAIEIIAYRFSDQIGEDFNSSGFEKGMKRWVRTYWANFLFSRPALAAAFCALGNAGGSERNLAWLFDRVVGREKPFANLEECEVTALVNTYFVSLGSLQSIDHILVEYENSKSVNCEDDPRSGTVSIR